MAMSDSSFDLILQDLLHQQNFMENLEAENQELRQQIADLRAGKGITVEILGHRFALHSEPTNTSYIASQTPTVSQVQMAPTASEVPTTPRAVEEYQETLALPVLAPANTIKETKAEELELTAPIPETPYPVMDFLLEDDSPISSSAFLQEMQETDEFSFESTNKLAVWGEPTSSPTPIPASASLQGPKQQQSPAPIDEHIKATLRRELIGSFLLE